MKPRARRRLLVSGVAVAVLVAGAALLRPAVAHRLSARYFAPRPGPTRPPADSPVPIEEITFAADDGSALEGWWYSTRARPSGVILFAHGNAWHLERQQGFPSRLTAAGWHVLAFDYRGFGDSEGEVSRRHAREDVLSALAVARERALAQDLPLVVAGQSMGAALVLEALGRSARDEGVAAIIVDSPFSSWSEIGAWHLADGRLARQALGALLDVVIAPTGRDPLDAVAGGVGVPMLVISGTADAVTPAHMARDLAAAARAELVELEDAGHPGSRRSDHESSVTAAQVAFLGRVTR